MASTVWSHWMTNQKPRAHLLRGAPVFYRNLEEALDVRRKDRDLYTLIKNTWTDGASVDFCTNDSLSLGASGRLRMAFDAELARNPSAQLGSCGSRLFDGNYEYIDRVEQEIAEYHGAEAALIVGSGCGSNYAVFEAIPRPGDAIVYDELVHASIVDGISRSLAATRVPFAHNDADAFRKALTSVRDAQPLIKQGKKCVLIAVEGFYSMDGDICPLRELVQVAKEVLPSGNAQFVVDEAHSMGVVGAKGLGFVAMLGLDSEIAIKTHTFSKAFASIGGVILCNETVKNALVNFSRSTIFTAAPAFHAVAAIRAGYTLMPDAESEAGRASIQRLVKRFFEKLTADTRWEEASDRGIVSMPITEHWKQRDVQTQLAILWTREHYGHYLCFHLDARNLSLFTVKFPVVPRGTSRVRIVVHANHTDEQIDSLVAAICEWTQEMVGIERDGNARLPCAAQRVLAAAAVEDGKSGNGATYSRT